MKNVLFDKRRQMIIPGNDEVTLNFAIEDWIQSAKHAISVQGYFAVALSGGSTPKAIYSGLSKYPNALDWSKVLLFWSDERACSPTDVNSNYKMAMDAGFSSLPILPKNIFAMKGIGDLEENAKEYEQCIAKNIPSKKFDLMMLGLGDDGHTASLFPKTHGLHTNDRDVIANFIPQNNVWRLSLTFDCINRSLKSVVYVLGANKSKILEKVFFAYANEDVFPIQRVGTDAKPAYFILDEAAASNLF